MKPELVKYRLERAEESLEETAVLITADRMKGAVNRLYYSMFYAVSALLETDGFSSSKHTGVRSLFNRHFVKPGIVSKETGDFFNRIFEARHKGDYMDFVVFTREQVTEDYDSCRKSVSEIRSKIYDVMKLRNERNEEQERISNYQNNLKEDM